MLSHINAVIPPRLTANAPEVGVSLPLMMNDLKIGMVEESENKESIYVEIPCVPGTTVYVIEFYGVREYIVDSFTVVKTSDGGLGVAAKDSRGYQFGIFGETVFLSEIAAERKIIQNVCDISKNGHRNRI